MKVAIVGSRTFNDYEKFHSLLIRNTRLSPSWEKIVSGGATGTDQLAERLAKEYQIELKVIYPNWKEHGKSAGPLRNKEIVDGSDLVIAFWDGASAGTKSTIKLAKQAKKHTIIFYI